MTELHLFAGAGGGILGGLLLGHTPVCAVEIDPYCQEVLRARQSDGMLPAFPIHGDITTFDGRPYRRGYLDSLVRTWYPIGDNPTPKELDMAGKLKKLTADQAVECVRMYDTGLSCGDIAGYYGVSRQAMHDLLTQFTNTELVKLTGVNYYTVASWRFKYNCNQLSMEKQIEILTKLNYQPTQNLLWKKQAK